MSTRATLPTPVIRPPAEPALRPSPGPAAAFAGRWYAAWNARDLGAVMARHEPTVEHSSPFIRRYNGADDAWLVGEGAVRDCFRRAPERNPTLRFDPPHTAVGLFGVTPVHRRMTGDLAAELFVLSERGRVLRSVSHYGRGRSPTFEVHGSKLEWKERTIARATRSAGRRG
jgi:hypothetical protein